jgi:hypothetical protein
MLTSVNSLVKQIILRLAIFSADGCGLRDAESTAAAGSAPDPSPRLPFFPWSSPNLLALSQNCAQADAC